MERTTPPEELGKAMTGDKGLKQNAVSYISSIVIGVASTAPGYSLAAVLGFVILAGGAEALSNDAVGFQAPAILIISFVPMLFIASAYSYMNKADLFLEEAGRRHLGLAAEELRSASLLPEHQHDPKEQERDRDHQRRPQPEPEVPDSELAGSARSIPFSELLGAADTAGARGVGSHWGPRAVTFAHGVNT